MRSSRLLLGLFCLIFFPILFTLFSAFSSSKVATPNTLAGRSSGLHALFSFNIPTSLFPPSAIISLTDDNSTFFLARPAAFGPLLPGKGLSGRLWVGSGFGEPGLATASEGELGCSDIPGWGEGSGHKTQDAPPRGTEQKTSRPGGGTMDDAAVPQNRPRLPSQVESVRPNDRHDGASLSTNDGTDDHLHHPLPESGASGAGATRKYGDYVQSKQYTHADIQSLQEMAEIQGNVVLLSRGGCGFLEKVKWAQRRGATAVIVGDDTRGGNLVTMYARGDTSNITIPALFTSHTTGHLLSSLIPGHSGAAHGVGDALTSLQAKLAGQANVDVQKATATTTSILVSTPTVSSMSSSTINERPTAAQPSGGFFRTLGSLLGLCDRHGGSKIAGDSRRPPNSGNLDWMRLGSWDSASSRSQSSKSLKEKSRHRGKADDKSSSPPIGLVSESVDGDDFVIGVQDWRDPDLMPPRESALPIPSTSTSGKESLKTSAPDNDIESGTNILRGGSITPGSGEYQSIDRSTGNVHDAKVKELEKEPNAAKEESSQAGTGWFSSHFGWGDEDSKQVAQPSASPLVQNPPINQKTQTVAQSSATANPMFTEHEGLWVTLTPTSMSTSPFFDTLLVLVISPLLTLTVVYALLLLRSRIRRRRWRAPKSVVERLPVRTYHTIASISSSSSSSSLRNAIPGPVTPASPLLGSGNLSGASRPTRSRSQTIAGMTVDSSLTPKEEKSTTLQSGSILWRRKYTGRQVECVVCLEEYIDGQSRVMSLPVGMNSMWNALLRGSQPDDEHVRFAKEMLFAHWRILAGMTPTPNLQSESSSAPLLIASMSDDMDTEQHAGLDAHASSAPQSSWRNLATLSFSALSGDTIWHQARADRNR
ncbi:hypothetical protein N7509_008717 [Penicillium cosmopolitanum]|uniref:PA domain-containing protein n=1 Tax=Penicillium cosmopolitanum TaxID=1131564 RepID=A0A9W9VN21_9EURO|nr:uncharacterized protein N7509_008717 [Penicillium cosmopolitanum]KAJ5386176.1 hypothetical protein N7509_008717 [Penicillium cosmopolitanum]